jgi:cytochrome c peroxidase
VVVFVNDDRTAHNITVTGEGLALNGGLQQPGAEFKVPFAKPGTYQVSCGIHPKMKLSVQRRPYTEHSTCCSWHSL